MQVKQILVGCWQSLLALWFWDDVVDKTSGKWYRHVSINFASNGCEEIRVISTKKLKQKSNLLSKYGWGTH